jgi:two-component system, NarL family, response regulator DevR
MTIRETDNTMPRREARRRSAGLPIHVLVVDDHPAVRRGVRQLLEEQPDLAVLGEAGSAMEAVGDLARWVDVAVVDYHLGGRDGLWLARELRRGPRAPRVLVYSAFADHALTVAAIIAGADGLLSKQALGEELCAAIRRVASGRQHLPAVPGSLTGALRGRLARREQAVFDMLLHGLPAEATASRLGIAPPEIEARREAILAVIAPKLGPSSPRLHAPFDYQRERRRPRHRAA